MSFSATLKMLSEEKRIPTLGGKSSFLAWSSGNEIIIQNSGGNSRRINAQYWEEVQRRRLSLGFSKNNTSMYTDPAWGLPYPTDRIFAPYVAAIMKFVERA